MSLSALSWSGPRWVAVASESHSAISDGYAQVGWTHQAGIPIDFRLRRHQTRRYVWQYPITSTGPSVGKDGHSIEGQSFGICDSHAGVALWVTADAGSRQVWSQTNDRWLTLEWIATTTWYILNKTSRRRMSVAFLRCVYRCHEVIYDVYAGDAASLAFDLRMNWWLLTRQPWIGAGHLATPVCASFIETGRRWAFKDGTNRGAGITRALLYLKLKIQTFQQVFHAFTGVTDASSISPLQGLYNPAKLKRGDVWDLSCLCSWGFSYRQGMRTESIEDYWLSYQYVEHLLFMWVLTFRIKQLVYQPGRSKWVRTFSTHSPMIKPPAKVVTAVIAGPPASLMRILVNGKAEGPRSAFAHGLVRNMYKMRWHCTTYCTKLLNSSTLFCNVW